MTKERKFRPRYTIDAKERIRVYYDREAWDFLKKSDERQVKVRELPKEFVIYQELSFYDV